MVDILTQIIESYLSLDYEPNTNLLEYDEAKEYFHDLLKSDNIVYLFDGDGVMTAWMEVWFLNEEQISRVILDKEDFFNPRKENILNGNICYVADLFIQPKYREYNDIIWRIWQKAEKIHGKPKVITFERRRLDDKFRVFKGGG